MHGETLKFCRESSSFTKIWPELRILYMNNSLHLRQMSVSSPSNEKFFGQLL